LKAGHFVKVTYRKKPMNTLDQPVIASLVVEEQRLEFLPTYFGPRLMLRGEALVFDWLATLSEDYGGGFWNFYTLTNGGFYMAPASDKRMHLEVDGNGFSGQVSADAAGIVATLFALNQLAAEMADTHAGDVLSERYHFLRDFVSSHPEAASIFQAID
jgi:Antirestriction protein